MSGHVLVARLDSAGDVLLSGPAVRAVAAGARRVTFLCGRRGRPAAELLPGVDEIVEHTAPWIDPDPAPLDADATHRLVDVLAGLDLDEAIVLTSFHQSALPLALLLRLAGVPRITGVASDYPGSLLDVRVQVDERGDQHEVERALGVVAAAGYRLAAGDQHRLSVVRPWGPPLVEGEYVVLHPGTSVPARAWPAARHAALVEALAGQGRTAVVTGSADERELTRVVAGTEGLDLGGRTTFAELADVLADAEVVVAGNTGPAHLAAAVGTPVVSLFAPTVPAARWRPWGVPVELLGDQDAPCAGSRARSCPVEGHPCLCSVSVADAARAVGCLTLRRELVGA